MLPKREPPVGLLARFVRKYWSVDGANLHYNATVVMKE